MGQLRGTGQAELGWRTAWPGAQRAQGLEQGGQGACHRAGPGPSSRPSVDSLHTLPFRAPPQATPTRPPSCPGHRAQGPNAGQTSDGHWRPEGCSSSPLLLGPLLLTSRPRGAAVGLCPHAPWSPSVLASGLSLAQPRGAPASCWLSSCRFCGGLLGHLARPSPEAPPGLS